MKSATTKATSASGARKRAGLRSGHRAAMIAAALRDRLAQAASAQAASRRRSASARAARAGLAAVLLVGVGDRARRGHEAARAAGANAGASAATSPPCAPTPGQQERRARHQLAHPREVLGHGGAGHGADVAERPALAQLVDQRARRSHSGSPSRRAGRSSDVGGAGVGGAHEHEHARAGVARRGDQRLERVAPEQRVGGERVGAEARRRRRTASACSPTSACA